MARGIQEGDLAVVDLDLVCTDGLGDAASLASGDVGLTDGVQDTGLAVVNVTHDTDYRGTLHQNPPGHPPPAQTDAPRW